jgi:glycerol-3-phosphate acyltransferase PlsX
MPIDFVGNIEGRDLADGKADVVVTDGFTGNVLLKTVEGTARVVARDVLEALSADDDPAFQAAVSLVLPSLMAVRARLDPEAHGGAHLVGVKGTVVIAHGSSSRVAIGNALEMAADGWEQGLLGKIEAGLDG